MKTIVALTGVKTSGKTTAFNFIKEAYPDVVEIQIARKLKDVCASVFGVDRALFDDPARKEVELETPVYLTRKNIEAAIEAYGKVSDYDRHVRPHVGKVLESPRRLAQYIGTEVLRNVDLDIHCIGAVMDLPEDGFFVVTDMRFLSEFDFFKNNFAAEFFPYYIQSNRAEETATDPHPSEREVREVAKKCKPVPNNGGMAEFRLRILDEVESLAPTLVNTKIVVGR
jgi:hypothetical protein